jgi:hypothetical protein
MTATPEVVPPLVAVGIPGLLRVDYLAYPLVDHIADKVSACFEIHVRERGGGALDHIGSGAATVLVKRMLDPVLAGTAYGHWDPTLATWLT